MLLSGRLYQKMRRESGKTQKWVAEKLGISQQMVSIFENDKLQETLLMEKFYIDEFSNEELHEKWYISVLLGVGEFCGGGMDSMSRFCKFVDDRLKIHSDKWFCLCGTTMVSHLVQMNVAHYFVDSFSDSYLRAMETGNGWPSEYHERLANIATLVVTRLSKINRCLYANKYDCYEEDESKEGLSEEEFGKYMNRPRSDSDKTGNVSYADTDSYMGDDYETE